VEGCPKGGVVAGATESPPRQASPATPPLEGNYNLCAGQLYQRRMLSQYQPNPFQVSLNIHILYMNHRQAKPGQEGIPLCIVIDLIVMAAAVYP